MLHVVKCLCLLPAYYYMLACVWQRPPATNAQSTRVLHPGYTWGVHNSYSNVHPDYLEQYYRGARFFEVDVNWWWHSWIVSHVPIFSPRPRVTSFPQTVCQLRHMGRDNVLFIDIKSVLWSSCGDVAVDQLVKDIQSCADDGPLTVMIDVSCDAYDNTKCAHRLRRASIPNTRLLIGGVTFRWLMVNRNGLHYHRHCTPEFHIEEHMPLSLPTLLQCSSDITRQSCVAAAQRLQYNMTWLQFYE